MGLVPWPPAETDSEDDGLVARPFGAGMSDLAVDFDRPPDSVIGAVLQSCLSATDGSGFTGAEIAGWSMAKRRQGLLAVAAATSGPRRTITVDCSREDCGEKLDLEVDLASFRSDWRIGEVPFEGGRLRLPRPEDLVALGTAPPERLAHILFEGTPPDREGWEVDAEEALSAADPLGDVELRASCPACGADVSVPLELETFLLRELERETTRLMDEIHVLAFAYHWTEPDIMALPEARRRQYLTRIQEAWAA